MAEFRFTPEAIDDLDDDAFVIVKVGGARDSTGRTVPRGLRVGPFREPTERRVRFDTSPGPRRLITAHDGDGPIKGKVSARQLAKVVAEVNAGTLPLSRRERELAWNRLTALAREAGVTMPPRRF